MKTSTVISMMILVVVSSIALRLAIVPRDFVASANVQGISTGTALHIQRDLEKLDLVCYSPIFFTQRHEGDGKTNNAYACFIGPPRDKFHQYYNLAQAKQAATNSHDMATGLLACSWDTSNLKMYPCKAKPEWKRQTP